MKTTKAFTGAVLFFLISVGLLVIPFSAQAKSSPWLEPSPSGTSSLNGLDRVADKVDIFLEKDTHRFEKPGVNELDKVEAVSEDNPFELESDPIDEYMDDDPFATSEEDIAEIEEDTMESFNRVIFGFNEGLMDYFFTPVAKGFRAIIPEGGRRALGNAFYNLSAPARLVSSMVQLDADKSGRVLGRFLINSTIGIGGFFDVAEGEFEIEKVHEDFGQALAVSGVPSGPYIVLPIFGPSTTRHAVGRVVDAALNPLSYFGIGVFINAGVSVSETVTEYSFNIEDIEGLRENAIDPYEGMRHFYLEIREKQIRE